MASLKSKLALGVGGLAAIIATSQTSIPRNAWEYLNKKLDTYVYDADMGQKYVTAKYTIKKGDALDRLARGNGLAVDYMKIMNDIKDPGNLRIGKQITILVPSDEGMTLREYFRNLPK